MSHSMKSLGSFEPDTFCSGEVFRFAVLYFKYAWIPVSHAKNVLLDTFGLGQGS